MLIFIRNIHNLFLEENKMNQRSPFVLKIAPIFIVLVFVAAFFVNGSFALALGSGPDGPVTDEQVTATPSDNGGEGQLETGIPASQGGDGLPEDAKSLTQTASASGPDTVPNAATIFSYFQLVGTAFNVRTTSTTYAYNFNGCVYETGGTDNRFMAPLLIPNGSILKYLRLYYNDTSAATDITAWITRYQPGSTSEDLTSVNSAGSSGLGSTLSSEMTHIVDTANWAYTIVLAPNANSSTNSFCGIRVAYYAPTFSALALPLINKGAP
jgi:hypothetical protein